MDVLGKLREALSDRYGIEGEAGSGGMATVYSAQDLKHPRRVAIKVLRPELAAALGSDRFLREIETAARLQHPHILPLYDSGNAGGPLYYVMPFVEGETLRQRLQREGQLPIEDALRITRQAGEALAFAHARNVVHRDIKPENILLSEGTAVVADFGIATAITAAGGTKLTSTGFSLGTPDYMSPEQSSAETVDGRADQYSLGCVLYEMLAGSPPFHGANARIVLARHTLDPVPSLRSARPNITPALDQVVQRTLSKVPADRYPTMRAFLEALSRAEAVTGATESLVAPKRTGRWPLVAAGVAALALTMLAGRALLQRRAAAPEGPPKLAVLPFSFLGQPEDRYIADGMTEEIRSRVAGISAIKVIARASAGSYPPGTPLTEIARDLQVSYLITGEVRTDRGPTGEGQVRVTPHLVRAEGEEDLWSGGFDATLAPGRLFAVQGAIAESVAAKLNVSLLLPERAILAAQPTSNAQAYQAFLQGNVFSSRRYEEAPARLAVESYRQAVTQDPAFALAHARLAEAQTMYYYFHDRNEARLDTARTEISRAFALDGSLMEARLARGYLSWWGRLDSDSAFVDLNAVRAVEPNNSEVLWIIGNVERRSGKWLASLETLQRAFELDPRSSVYALDLSTTSLVLRRYDDAMRYVDRSLALAPDAVAAVMQKSLIYWERGDSLGARRVVQGARSKVSVLDILKFSIRRHPQHIVVIGGDIRDSLEAMSSAARLVDPAELYLAKAYSFEKRGDSVRARAHYDSARVVLEPRVQAAPGQADFHSMLGVAYAGVGRREDAIREGDRAIEILPISKEAAGGVFPLTTRIRIALLNGEREVALRHLATLLDIPSVLSKTLVRSDPFFAQLRGDPEFKRLVSGPEHTF